MNLIEFFRDSLTNYCQPQITLLIHNVTDIRSPAYMYLVLLILIKIYRKFFLETILMDDFYNE
jgi:hypothetical protein